jgi:hypothetical protein
MFKLMEKIKAFKLIGILIGKILIKYTKKQKNMMMMKAFRCPKIKKNILNLKLR